MKCKHIYMYLYLQIYCKLFTEGSSSNLWSCSGAGVTTATAARILLPVYIAIGNNRIMGTQTLLPAMYSGVVYWGQICQDYLRSKLEELFADETLMVEISSGIVKRFDLYLSPRIAK